MEQVLVFPEKHAIKIDVAIRTTLMRPFPYLLFFVVEDGVIYFLTVQYAGRKPAFLRSLARERRANELPGN